MAIDGRIRSFASEFRGYSHQLQFLFGGGAMTSEILASIGQQGWRIKRLISVDAARAVIAVGPPGAGEPAAVIKVSRNREAAAVMARERKVLSQIRSDPRLAEIAPLIPTERAWGRIGEHAFVVEGALPGVDARAMLDDQALSARMQSAALEVAAILHGRTARTVTVGRALTNRWIAEPLQRIERLGASFPRIGVHAHAIDALRDSMTDALTGRTMVVSWLHGDFFPGNILVSPDAMSVTGLVDWDLAAPDELPLLDTMQLLLGTHLLRSRSELGATVLEMLDGGGLSAADLQTIREEQLRSGAECLTIREAAVLTWLRHIGCNLAKSGHFRRHRLWVKANVEAVLESLSAVAWV